MKNTFQHENSFKMTTNCRKARLPSIVHFYSKTLNGFVERFSRCSAQKSRLPLFHRMQTAEQHRKVSCSIPPPSLLQASKRASSFPFFCASQTEQKAKGSSRRLPPFSQGNETAMTSFSDTQRSTKKPFRCVNNSASAFCLFVLIICCFFSIFFLFSLSCRL